MRISLRLAFYVAAFPLVMVVSAAADDPDLVDPPRSIRIQALDDPAKGVWVELAGFIELGSPTMSRDGQWIAFDAYKEGFNRSRAECWIARRDGRDLKRLTYGAVPRFSPDGKRILFFREKVNGYDGPDGVFVVNIDGAGETRIGPGRWPDWSPDGKWIAMSVGGEETGGARIGAMICVAKADGSDVREIAQGDCPSWSPDGKKLAYCYRAPESPPRIMIRDAQGDAKATEVGIGFFRPNWTSDGESLVCNGVQDEELAMVRLYRNGPQAVFFQPNIYSDPMSPFASSNGREVVFIARKAKPPAKQTPARPASGRDGGRSRV